MPTGNKFLVETAFLTHGVSDLSETTILEILQEPAVFTWLSQGEVMLGGLKEFLAFKAGHAIEYRIDCSNFRQACQKKLTGALTASGTMMVCEKMQRPFAVSAGIGGISEIAAEKICPDLEKIANSRVTLVATSFKDMMDRPKTFKWLKKHGITVYNRTTDFSSGFMFQAEKIPVKIFESAAKMNQPCLILNEILPTKRISDSQFLKEMITAGKQAEKQGDYYHPAANNKLAQLTNNQSTYLQLKSLQDNIRWAYHL